MGQGNTGIGWGRNGRSNSRNDLEGNAGPGQFLRLLPAPPENKGIPPLQASHRFSLSRLGDDQTVDLILGKGVIPALLSHIDLFCSFPDVAEQLFVGQVVIDHYIGPLQAGKPLDRDQPRIPGSGSYEVDDSRAHAF